MSRLHFIHQEIISHLSCVSLVKERVILQCRRRGDTSGSLLHPTSKGNWVQKAVTPASKCSEPTSGTHNLCCHGMIWSHGPTSPQGATILCSGVREWCLPWRSGNRRFLTGAYATNVFSQRSLNTLINILVLLTVLLNLSGWHLLINSSSTYQKKSLVLVGMRPLLPKIVEETSKAWGRTIK